MSRKDGIGASEIWMVFDDPMGLYLRKVGITEDPEENEAMWLGKEFEPVMDRRYEKETGFKPVPTPPIIHPREPWRRCSPDRIVRKEEGQLVLLEYKTTGYHEGWGEPGTDEVPDKVGMQVQWQLSLIPGMPAAEVPVYFFAPRREFAIYKLERNEEIIANLVEAGRDFWNNHVVPQIPPPLDASDSSRELLRHLYPQSGGEVLPAPDEALRWRNWLEAAKLELKSWEEKKKLAQHHLEALVGNADSLLWPDGWRFDWKRQKDGKTIDWEGIAKKYCTPQDIAEFTKTKPGVRVARLWPPKKGGK